MAQTTGADTPPLVPFVSKESLFSEHYLLNVLPQSPEWDRIDAVTERVRATVLDLLKRQASFPAHTEQSLDREFFTPVFEALGHHAFVQTRTHAGKFPDYSFFESEQAKHKAENLLAKDREAFFKQAIALGELKRWDYPLDGGKRADDLDAGHPTGQLYRYLLRQRQRWGILTNGRKWRLYHYDGAWPRVGRYYEVDLVALARSRNPQELRYFVYFFRREAFVADGTGKAPLDHARDGSVEYSQELAEDLKDAVYRALGELANGFLAWPANNLDATNADHVKAIHENALKLLYRLLFVLKAEAAGLLPLDNPVYRRERSLDALKHRIRDRRRERRPILNDGDTYYAWLKRLFALIDSGSAPFYRNQPDPLGIPPYNGGLFHQKDSAGRESFLATHSIGDAHLAEAIDLLARRTGTRQESEGFVDYSSLEAQQLGTLYEGLLEYQLGHAATEDYVADKDDKWIPESSHVGQPVTDPKRRAPKGTLFLQTDKGERHTTGTYYTPDFIVRHIIQKTLEPALERRLMEATAKGTAQRDAVLSVRVLDPAMGSGHFLVDVVDYLTPRLLEAIDADRAAGLIGDEAVLTTEDARREIAAHCIYGVDLNPMAVELAKVTLWLHTLEQGKPLTFLDHRLKRGNALLGADIRRLPKYPTKEAREKWEKELAKARKERTERRFEEPVAFPELFLERITGRMAAIEDLRDETIEEVKRKQEMYDELRTSPEFVKIKATADAWLAAFCGVPTAKTDPSKAGKNYTDLQWALKNDRGEQEWQEKAARSNLAAIQDVASEKGFFHWEFEFPEVFFEGGVLRPDAGFDAVVGNPPYLSLETLNKADHTLPPIYKQFYESGGEGRYDIYVLFVERGYSLLKPSGEFGFILPNKWFKGQFGRPLRSMLTRKRAVREIVDWRGYYTIFYSGGTGPVTYVALLFLSRKPNAEFRYVAFPSLTAKDSLDVARERLARSADLEDHHGSDITVGRISLQRLGDAPWVFATGDAHALLERLRKLPALGSVANVFEGVTTAAVPVYFLRDAKPGPSPGVLEAWSDKLGRHVEIEEGAVRPLLQGKDVTRWRILSDSDVILWPYEETTEGTHVLIDAQRMQSGFPRAWAYLNEPSVRKQLESRETTKRKDPATGEERRMGRFEGREDWYAYSYPRSMARFSQPKVVLPDAASQGDAAWDEEGAVIANTLYGMASKSESNWDIHAVQALLNTDLLVFFVREMGSPLKDGFFRFATKYLEPFPMPEVSFDVDQEARETIKAQAQDLIGQLETHDDSRPLVHWVKNHADAGDLVPAHDGLAFLAARLNTLRRQAQEEVKAFLTWFQRTYLSEGARLEDFTGKTILRDYPKHPFEKILSTLKKNRKSMSADPRTRGFQEALEREYQESMRRHRPLAEAAQRLEPLVQEIVFLMYGLDEPERAVVHASAELIQYR